MAINLNGLVGAVNSAESAAASAVGGLNGSSTMADLTRAQLAMNQYQLVATAVTSIISSDAEAKKNGARNIHGG
ncbi:MAG TPA: hypothetical protein VKB34_16675 [Povalibacter sp.]|nr:hypothetical protein [Povalibacter sp.]